MKKLSELGISPAPWKKADDGMGYKDIWCNAPVTEDSEGENIIAEAIDAKDARLIAAAPELYKWLAFAVEYYKCETRSCDKCPNGKCWIVDATAALAKAAGEEVGDGK